MRTYGLLIDWVSSHYHQSIWMGIQQVCREQGVNLVTLVSGSPGSLTRWDQMRAQLSGFMRSGRFEGFLFQTASLESYFTPEQLEALVAELSPAPVVSLGVKIPGASTVLIESGAGFRAILEHLWDTHGYRRFAFAGGPSDSPDGLERKQLLIEFLRAHELEVREDWILDGTFSSAWGKQVVDLLIPGTQPDFEVLVCADDEIAQGVLDGLAQKGLLVPGDLAVTGFDDIFTSDLAALTTVRQPLMDLGRAGAQLLGELLDGRSVATDRSLPTEPMIRQSCGCLSLAALVSQVAPVSETKASFSHEALVHRPELLGDLVLEGLSPPLAEALVEAFLLGWEKQESPPFLMGLRRVLATMEKDHQPPGRLHFPLSVFRQWVLRSTEPAVRRAFLESTIHQARIVLTEALHLQSVRKQTQHQLRSEALSSLNERLMFSRNFSDQAEIMVELFSMLGIRRFRFTSFADPTHPETSARLVLTEKGEVPGGGRPYDFHRIFVEDEGPDGAPWSFVVETLFERNALLGFFLLEAREDYDLLSIFDQLGERIGRGVETVRKIQGLEDQVAQRTVELRVALEHLEAHNLKLKEMALRDELTGLYNRRGFLTLAEHQLKAQYRKNQELTLFFGDLDGLKTINDTWGHDAGDEAIRTAARLLSETFRLEDVVARLGGDEFVVLAPGCSESGASGLAGRLAGAFAQTASGRYGISLGWIVIDPRSPKTLSEWMREADEVLYREKQTKKARRAAEAARQVPETR